MTNPPQGSPANDGRNVDNRPLNDTGAPAPLGDTAASVSDAHLADEASMLVRLRDTDETIVGSDADIRGRTLVDHYGAELGTISDLLIDERDQKVRFMEIVFGGFLGLGRTHALIPIDVISVIQLDEVRIDRTAEHVQKSPAYDPELIENAPVNDTYGYYGLMPYWGIGWTR